MNDKKFFDFEHTPEPEESKNDRRSVPADKQNEKEHVVSSERDDQFTEENQTPEIATNDGSVIETLDTAFHGTPGWSEGENISGSSRADYYEARSYGKSDTEEELDEMRERNKNKSDNEGIEE